MTMIQPRIASGFPEYLPAEQIAFNRLLTIVRTTYEKYGFTPVDTVGIELAEVLLAKSGGDTEKEVYRFTKGSTDLALPFDQTVPLARFVASHQQELALPFFAYQIGRVHRGERSQAGRFREFYQCDIDVIGSKSPLVDAIFPAVINDIFEQFAFGAFTIRISNRRLINGFLQHVGEAEQSIAVIRLIDKIEKLPPEDLLDRLRQLGLPVDTIEKLMTFVHLNGSNQEILAALAGMNIENNDFSEGIAQLKTVINALEQMQIPEGRVRIDLKIVRGLDYYTGTVYETTLDNYPEIGSVCSGGRYDNLTGHYSNTALPGAGISIGLTRLFYKLQSTGLIATTRQTTAAVIVLPFDETSMASCLALATELRAAGIASLVYPEIAPPKKMLKYADKLAVPIAVIIGEQERLVETVQVKDMISGETVIVPHAQIVRFISDKLAA